MTSLAGKAIFLSASFPSGERGEPFQPADPAAIADAVTALARAVLEAEGRIVFGAHPTISPLVLLVAAEHRRAHVVHIYQSRGFSQVVPAETRRLEALGFGRIMWTDDLGERGRNLALMRKAMFDARPAAGVFIGGMEGIVEEFDALARRHADVPRCLIAAAGGAASRLAARLDARPPEGFESHVQSPKYPAVARAIVDLAARQPT